MKPDMDVRSCQPFKKVFLAAGGEWGLATALNQASRRPPADNALSGPSRALTGAGFWASDTTAGTRPGEFNPPGHDLQLRLSGPSNGGGNVRPILKYSQNRQKTVLPPPGCFGIMEVNQTTSVRPLQA